MNPVVVHSPYASRLLRGNYWVTTTAIRYINEGNQPIFTVDIPAGYLFQRPILRGLAKWLLSKQYMKAMVVYAFLCDTRSIQYKGKPFDIESRHCEILFLDVLLRQGSSGIRALALRYILPIHRFCHMRSPAYLLRKNAVEFYIRETYKLRGYYV